MILHGIPTVAIKGGSNIDMQSLLLYMKVHVHDDLTIFILSRSFQHKERTVDHSLLQHPAFLKTIAMHLVILNKLLVFAEIYLLLGQKVKHSLCTTVLTQRWLRTVNCLTTLTYSVPCGSNIDHGESDSETSNCMLWTKLDNSTCESGRWSMQCTLTYISMEDLLQQAVQGTPNMISR